MNCELNLTQPLPPYVHTPQPCMSARLFACYTLVSEQSDESGHATRRDQSTKLPILQLLQSMVHVESSSLGQTVEHKTVQFSAYEGSATRPPRDSVLGSHVPRHVNINAMVHALDQVNNLLESGQEKGEVLIILILASLQGLSAFLTKLESNEDGKALRQVCAKSMPFRWIPERFQKAAKLYRRDVDKICQCLENNASLKEADVQLNLEKKLADSLGRAIRFHLRRFFNSIYGKVIQDPGSAEPAFKRQSKIHEIMQMTLPGWYAGGGSDSAVADGSVSAVFSLAIETIEGHFGKDPFLAKHFHVPTIPDVFCNSEASQRGLGRTCTMISEQDIETIVSDTSAAQGFLAGAKACRFLTELKNWPGVREDIARLGGWSIVERCAQQFHTFDLVRLSPHDAHFCLLADMFLLLDRVELCWNAMEQASKDCTIALNQQWARFDCDNSSKRRRFPVVEIVKDLLLEGLKAHMFPNIEEPEEEGTWDE